MMDSTAEPANAWTSTSPEQTRGIGAECVRAWSHTEVVALAGPLGSGKTTFVKGVIEELGGDPEGVRSPTYTLLQRYDEFSPTVVHVDLYRTETAEAQETVGLSEYFGEGLVLVEWAGRWELGWPPGTQTLRFEHQDPSVRNITLFEGSPEDLPEFEGSGADAAGR